ncbi:hypothetical protein [Streptomyces sp. NPDC046939]|uniref:hypothetical protein n=1 Tax=Streptomyces sp. NPDC046939 TaxID=3155376 RepID=UPI0033F18FBA
MNSDGMGVEDLVGRLDTAAGAGERRRWAAGCAQMLGLDGVAVSVQGELLWFSDPTSTRLEDIQVVLGQGPGLETPSAQILLEIPALETLPLRVWPQFVPEALALGVAAMFVWPVHAGAPGAGIFTGFRRAPGPLTPTQRTHGRQLAHALIAHVLAHWPGSDSPAHRDGQAGVVDLQRAAVHQAAGITAVDLNLPVDAALLRLRAHAWMDGYSLQEIAHEVVADPLHLDPA